VILLYSNFASLLLPRGTSNGSAEITFEIDRFHSIERFLNDNLLDAIRDNTDNFNEASGISHTFPKPWRRIEQSGSFKTRDRQANLQLTFATNSDNQLLVDIDNDDNQGIAHAFDVIGHALTGANTHPYNIHQVLLALQGIDPGYTLSESTQHGDKQLLPGLNQVRIRPDLSLVRHVNHRVLHHVPVSPFSDFR
jgi:hypothetical protein